MKPRSEFSLSPARASFGLQEVCARNWILWNYYYYYCSNPSSIEPYCEPSFCPPTNDDDGQFEAAADRSCTFQRYALAMFYRSPWFGCYFLLRCRCSICRREKMRRWNAIRSRSKQQQQHKRTVRDTSAWSQLHGAPFINRRLALLVAINHRLYSLWYVWCYLITSRPRTLYETERY